MRISEIFESIQGEGEFAGTPTVFVRTTGCNLRCWFCDTPYTSWRPEGEQRPWRDVLKDVAAFGCEHVVVTGGEPLLQPNVVDLTHALAEAGHFVTIETAGTVYRPVHADLMSVSPKRDNSQPNAPARWDRRHNQLRDNPDVIARLLDEFSYQLKFVIDRPADVADVPRYLERFPQVQPARVWLMPQATTREELAEKTAWLADAAQRLGYRCSPRLHIEFYGNVRGK